MAAAPQPAPTTNKPAAPRKKFGLPTSVPKNPETSSNPEKGSTNAEGSAEPSKPVTKPASKPTIPNLTKPALTNKAAALVKPAAPTAKVVLKPAAAKAGPSKGAAVGEDGDDGAGPSGDGADVKKPKSAYIFFSADYRAVIKGKISQQSRKYVSWWHIP